MYRQENKSGFIQYLSCIFIGIFIWILCDIIGLLIHNIFIADVMFVIFACILVYFTYAHYCALFSYELSQKKLIISRKIGHREIKEEIKLSDIYKICTKKSDIPLPKNTKSFTVKIFNKSNYCFVFYKKDCCIIFEPDNKLLKLLKENIND